jgi:hypothetical protein
MHMEREAMKSSVAGDLLDLRFQQGLRDGQVDVVKQCVVRWIQERDAVVHRALADFLKPGVDPAEVDAAFAKIPLFAGLETNWCARASRLNPS